MPNLLEPTRNSIGVICQYHRRSEHEDTHFGWSRSIIGVDNTWVEIDASYSGPKLRPIYTIDFQTRISPEELLEKLSEYKANGAELKRLEVMAKQLSELRVPNFESSVEIKSTLIKLIGGMVKEKSKLPKPYK